MFVIGQFLIALAGLIDMVLRLFLFLIFVRALISWVNPDPYNPIVQFLYRTTEPVLAPIRQLMPAIGLDISPIIVFFLIEFLRGFLVPVIYRMGMSLQ